MNPRAYFDIEALGASSTGGGQIPALPVITRLVSVLHGIFRLHPGRFALAFPRLKSGESRHPGHVVRVFADTREDLDIIVEALTANQRIHGYVRYGYPKSVSPDFKGPWKEYRRYRIPGNGSRLEKCRQYRLEAAESLPYLRMASKSNGQGFVLFVDCRDGAAPGDCEPDSYGLSLPSRAFALPMVA
jgi:hypothetical protein